MVMRTKLLAWAGLIVLCCGVGSAEAQQPPPATPPAPPPAVPAGTLSVIVVDVQALLQNSKAAKMVRQQIEAKRAD